MGIPIKLTNVIISYPHIFKARSVLDSDPKYSAEFLIANTTENAPMIARIQQAIAEAKKDKWGDRLPPNIKEPLFWGPHKKPGIAEYENVWVLRSARKEEQGPPAVVNQRREPVTDPLAFPAGCIVNAYVDAYAFSSPLSKGITTGLNGVQLVDNVNYTPLGNRPTVDQMFEEVEGAPPPVNNNDGGDDWL